MTIDTTEMIAPTETIAIKTPKKSTPKRKPATDPAKGLAKALETVEKLEERNHDAGQAIRDLSELWLSPDASKKRVEAEIALNHFDAALAALRKSITAMSPD